MNKVVSTIDAANRVQTSLDSLLDIIEDQLMMERAFLVVSKTCRLRK